MSVSVIFSSIGNMATTSVGTRSPDRASVSPISTTKDADKPEAPSKQTTIQALSDEALAQIGKLQVRDTKVRQHEAAHLAAAGGLAVSGASFTYQKGPDGVNYAVGGEVSIDVSPGRTPQDTIARARTIKAAALAPADPSGADLAVAAKAQQLEQQAHGELTLQQIDPSTSTQHQATNVKRMYGMSDGIRTSSLSVFA